MPQQNYKSICAIGFQEIFLVIVTINVKPTYAKGLLCLGKLTFKEIFAVLIKIVFNQCQIADHF